MAKSTQGIYPTLTKGGLGGLAEGIGGGQGLSHEVAECKNNCIGAEEKTLPKRPFPDNIATPVVFGNLVRPEDSFLPETTPPFVSYQGVNSSEKAPNVVANYKRKSGSQLVSFSLQKSYRNPLIFLNHLKVLVI